MKVAILNISDIHFDNWSDLNELRISKICSALYSLEPIDRIIILMPGDISQSGLESQYKIAGRFISLLYSYIKETFNDIGYIPLLCVPGNHDKDRGENSFMRDQIISAHKCKTLNDLEKAEANKMSAFFNFSNRNRCFNTNYLIDNRKIDINNKKINFTLINSAIYSVNSDEKGIHHIKPNDLFNMIRLNNQYESDINICVMHHNLNWFDQACCNQFENIISSNYSILITGHEHHAKFCSESIDERVQYFKVNSGVFLDRTNSNVSEFNVIILNMNENTFINYPFKWNADMLIYQKFKESKEYSFLKSPLLTNESFNKFLITDNKILSSVSLDKYFVFPEIELINSDDKKTTIIGSFEEFNKASSTQQRILISGASDYGKTCLLKNLYTEYTKLKYNVIYVNAENINHKKVDKIIKESLANQYIDSELAFNIFTQTNKNERIILIDNSNLIKSKMFTKFIEDLKLHFGKIILTSSDDIEVGFDIKKTAQERYDQNFNFQMYKIQKFYNNKRLILIENICKSFSKDIYTSLDESINHLHVMIKNNLNIYDLTPYLIVSYGKQLCEYGNFNRKDSKIFGKVYESNIINSLNIDNNLSVDFNYELLTKLARKVHFTKTYPFNRKLIDEVVKEYNKDYKLAIDSMNFSEDIVNSRIVREVELDQFRFNSNSILAYFIARSIVFDNYSDSQFDDLNLIMKNICFGINSDILLFVYYLTDNINVLNFIYKTANNFVETWNEFNISDPFCPYLKTFSYDFTIEIPTDEDSEKHNDDIDANERVIMDSGLIEVNDIYNYDEAEVDTFINSLTTALRYSDIISKILPSFNHRLRHKDKQYFIDSIISLPNKILYKWLEFIDANKDDVLNEFKHLIEINSLNEKITADHIFYDLIATSIIALYYNTSSSTIDKLTIDYFKDYEDPELKYDVIKLVMNEFSDNDEEFIKLLVKKYKVSKSNIEKLVIRKVARRFYLSHKKLPQNLKQKIRSEFFNEIEHPKLIYSDSIKGKSIN